MKDLEDETGIETCTLPESLRGQDLTRKQVILAHRIAAGDGITEAGRVAGYYDHSAAIRAAKLPKVQALIQEVRRQAAVATGVTLEYVVAKHVEIIEDQAEDTAARLRSLMAVADLLNLKREADRSETTRWQRMSESELDAEIERAQRAIDVTPRQIEPPDAANA